MLLENKVALIHGAAGAVGTAVALAFAREGAHVVVAGRDRSSLELLLRQTESEGGTGDVIVCDALVEADVEQATARAFQARQRLDIAFNLIGLDDVHGTPLTELDPAAFLTPVERAMRSHFLTARAAAKVMAPGGVLLALIANCAVQPVPNVGGFGVACVALAGLYRQLAVELGPKGVRALCLLSAGSPDSAGVREVFDLHAAAAGLDQEAFDRKEGQGTILGHLPDLASVADAAVVAASDRTRAMTAAVLNLTCGKIAD